MIQVQTLIFRVSWDRGKEGSIWRRREGSTEREGSREEKSRQGRIDGGREEIGKVRIEGGKDEGGRERGRVGSR